MSAAHTYDLSLMSWNILAPCWVEKEWYPFLYQVASDHDTRLSSIVSHISSGGHDVIILQEVQEDTFARLEEKLGQNYIYEFAPNNPTASSLANGLLTLIRKDWVHASEVQIINGILDSKEGEAIQIVTIPSKNIYLVNLHLHWIHRLSQSKMVQNRCNELLGADHRMTVPAGDLNAETEECNLFQWADFQDVFVEPSEVAKIPTYYPDNQSGENSRAIDHMFFDPNQVILLKYGKAWNVRNGSLADVLNRFGSDHIFVWAQFNFV